MLSTIIMTVNIVARSVKSRKPTDFGIAADSGTDALQVWRYIFRPRVDYRVLISPVPIETSPLPWRSRVEKSGGKALMIVLKHRCIAAWATELDRSGHSLVSAALSSSSARPTYRSFLAPWARVEVCRGLGLKRL